MAPKFEGADLPLRCRSAEAHSCSTVCSLRCLRMLVQQLGDIVFTTSKLQGTLCPIGLRDALCCVLTDVQMRRSKGFCKSY